MVQEEEGLDGGSEPNSPQLKHKPYSRASTARKVESHEEKAAVGICAWSIDIVDTCTYILFRSTQVVDLANKLECHTGSVLCTIHSIKRNSAQLFKTFWN